ncbi:sensor histidine kinase [Parapedobacter koreensis]|uniref:Histidine kinase n=1 Tax=Parapedobacter koreensis TaxID=332977 RepID=A0A1H7TKU5_9SPHI|nr:histidine kinase [Parapedobacter koreensis]SEL85099.1 Histidine kinase [Parapedobacter koreensis]
MKYIAFTKEDILVLFIIVFPYLFVVNYLLLGTGYFHFPLLASASLVSIAIGTASWATHIIAANIMRYTIAGYSNTVKRVSIQFPIYVMLSLLLGLSLFGAFRVLGFIAIPLTWANFRPVFIAGIILNVAATSFHEGLYAFDKWKAAMLETEQLKKNYLQSQLEGLKSQVNPHFLFNSLNSLSALIYTNPEKAGDFLDEMSKVYRYLLRSNERWLIPLRAEINFAHSFFHMLKTRYEDGIQLTIDVQEQLMEYVLPPLTLQMLLENAVKHNVISRESPLKIEITTTSPDLLVVSNNIQKKTTAVLSNGIGLQNIMSKYQLLNNSVVEIDDDGQQFVVKLPLLNPQNHEYISY